MNVVDSVCSGLLSAVICIKVKEQFSQHIPND